MKFFSKKSLGQNFLIDEKVLNLIVDLGKINSKDTVLEVGPGTGNLTEKIIKKCPKRFIVVEKDKNLSLFLKKKFNNDIEIINDDILNYNQKFLYKKKIIIFGNLPYNISTQILISWIKVDDLNKFCKKFILMFQKEVADRIAANVNSSKYGRLTVLTEWKMNAEKVLDINQENFYPKPKVKSSLMYFEPKDNFFSFENSKNLEKVTDIFFQNKRKMIKKPINILFEDGSRIIKKLNLDDKCRPQNLDSLTFFKIAREYEKQILSD